MEVRMRGSNKKYIVIKEIVLYVYILNLKYYLLLFVI